MLKRILDEHRFSILSIVTALGISIVVDLVTGEPAALDTQKTEVVLTLLELIALVLPALAITLQLSHRYSRSTEIEATGFGRQLREISFLAGVIGIGGLLFATFVLLESISLPRGMEIASFGILTAIFCMFLIIAMNYYTSLLKSTQVASRIIGIGKFYESLGAIEDLPEDLREEAKELQDDALEDLEE